MFYWRPAGGPCDDDGGHEGDVYEMAALVRAIGVYRYESLGYRLFTLRPVRCTALEFIGLVKCFVADCGLPFPKHVGVDVERITSLRIEVPGPVAEPSLVGVGSLSFFAMFGGTGYGNVAVADCIALPAKQIVDLYVGMSGRSITAQSRLSFMEALKKGG